MSKPTLYSRLLPTGAIILWGGVDMPNGFLLCNGASVSRSDYPDLAAALGETGTTFSLPDYRDRVPQGAGTVSPNVGVSAGVPDLSGSSSFRSCGEGGAALMESVTGAFRRATSELTSMSVAYSTSGLTNWDFAFSASRDNSIYGASNTVQMAAYTNHFLIKS